MWYINIEYTYVCSFTHYFCTEVLSTFFATFKLRARKSVCLILLQKFSWFSSFLTTLSNPFVGFCYLYVFLVYRVSLRWLFCLLCWAHKLPFPWGPLLGNCDVLEVVVFCGIVCFLFPSVHLEEHHLFQTEWVPVWKATLQMGGRVISMMTVLFVKMMQWV